MVALSDDYLMGEPTTLVALGSFHASIMPVSYGDNIGF